MAKNDLMKIIVGGFTEKLYQVRQQAKRKLQ